MSVFPRTEPEIVLLAETIIAGITAHPGDFPSILPAQLTALSAQLSAFREAKTDQETSKGQLHVMTSVKDENLDTLVEMIKSDLKKAEADCVNSPEYLAEIGWGPRQQPMPEPVPGQPDNFIPTSEGPGDIWFKWTSPASGGVVRNYIIERRQQPAGSSTFGLWEVVGTSVSNDIHLIDQPRGIQLEYSVKAANVSGESMPSNTAAVVL